MVIIFDKEGIPDKTYRGYLAKQLQARLATLMPEVRWLDTTAAGNASATPGATEDHFPRQRGLFRQQRTEKWLRQQKVNAFFSFTRVLKTVYPLQQVLLIGDEEPFKEEKSLNAATYIALFSSGLKDVLTERYPHLSSKSFLLANSLYSQAPFFATNDDVRETIAGGREYFIVADFNLTIEELTRLLKGFSGFKRMLHSSWKLMVVLRSGETISQASVDQLLSHYKYREDIIVTNGELLNEKLRDAYALISMDVSERVPVAVLEAAAVNTPAIVPETRSIKTAMGDNVVYMEEVTSEGVGAMLIKLYKEEPLRENLVKKLNGFTVMDDEDSDVEALVGRLR